MTQLAAGRFLLAKSSLDGTYFGKRIVLLLNYDPAEGAYGLVINRVARIPLNEVFRGVPKQHRRQHAFFLGGPVEEHHVQLLQVSRSEEGETVLPQPERHSIDIQELLKTIDDPSTRAFLGYSGWAPGQLESELERDDWEIHAADPMAVLNIAEELSGVEPEEFKRQFGAIG